jgi:signal transduction histidine kinase
VCAAVPLRSAAVVDATCAEVEGLGARLLLVRARGLPDGELAALEVEARRSFAGTAPLATQLLPDLQIAAMPQRAADASLALPLLLYRRPAAGLLVIEAARRVSDAEALFIRSVADQLALALERHAAHRRDVQLRERAEALEREKKELMAIVSHDLRNPLAAVLLGVSTLMRKPGMEPSLRGEHLTVIHRAAMRANRLIHDLLDAGRIEAGHLPLSREPLRVEPVVDEAVQIHKPLFEERELSCAAMADPDLPPVLADRERVLQVFSNLIGNAIRFSRPGGAIAVRVLRAPDAVRCEVADDGPGIAGDETARVFDRYWQGAPRHGHEAGAAGLGLAIAKGIVEAHGGRIWFESAQGRGCSFVFTLPAAASAAGA